MMCPVRVKTQWGFVALAYDHMYGPKLFAGLSGYVTDNHSYQDIFSFTDLLINFSAKIVTWNTEKALVETIINNSY